ncbi:MAG: hypothetical protein Q8O55_07335 [Dehalococcoidales bacterium]|nr:hypothetical protein [Dehalococcoidales bacterium]
MSKVKVEVEIPDGTYCNPATVSFCPFWWESEDGDIGCGLLNVSKEEYREEAECIKFLSCPNPE